MEILGRRHTDAKHVPYGANEIRVSESGFVSVWRSVIIAQKHTVVRVVLEVGAEECGGTKGVIGGQIRGMRRGEELWVKAVPVRGQGGDETMVSPSGSFLLAGLATGEYLVLITRGDQVIHSRTQRVGGSVDEGRSLHIDLKAER